MIRLFSACFPVPSPTRAKEYSEALRRNCECSAIDEICLFQEGGANPTVSSTKLRIKPVSGRPLYSDYFNWINELAGADDISIIANSDIYFDDQLELFRNWSMPADTVFILTRWQVDEAGQSSLHYRAETQDTWIFRGRVRPVKSDFPLGVARCDNRLAYELAASGFKVLNPSMSIRSHHLHDAPRRNYKPKEHNLLIPPPYAYIWPHNLWSLRRTTAYNSRHPSAALNWRFDNKWWLPSLKLNLIGRALKMFDRRGAWT